MNAPIFPDPEPLDFTDEQQEIIAQTVKTLYEETVISRNGGDLTNVSDGSWSQNHQTYDQMFRGEIEQFNPRTGPWEGASHLHVQAPYWLCSAINARLSSAIWSQTPLVVGEAEEDDDQETAINNAHLIDWNLQPKRMSARAQWSRISMTRLIHGVGNGLITHATDMYRYRTQGNLEPQFAPDGSPMRDDDDNLVTAAESNIEEGVFYQGPVLTPLQYDDVVVPDGAMNLQAVRQSNPLGADWVILRQVEYLSLIMSKDSYYANDEDEEWWLGRKPSQPFGLMGDNNTERITQQRQMEGVNALQGERREKMNPQYEVLTVFIPWEDPATGETEEMCFWICKYPNVFLGGYRLSDLVYTGVRPLLELHYQNVSNRYYSMGVMEIVEHLSEELDTIHNMRVDVGFATNLPWYFVRASAGIEASTIQLKPLELVPVEDPNDVKAPQVQNVTAFYHQEETLLLSIIERVFGVTDLFLGVSPTRGAAARHATGFMGTQQESEARMSEPIAQDAEAFSFLCRTVCNLEQMWGPQERTFRVLGEGGGKAKMTRDDLWFSGTYDFRLGANVGSYSQAMRFQRSQSMMQIAAASPLTQMDPGRRWEVEAEVYRSMGYRDAEIVKFIGPKSAVSQGDPVPQDEENAQMAQYAFGEAPAPVNPSDNDMEHLQQSRDFRQSDVFMALGRPNEQAFVNHEMMHNQQMMAKQQQQQMNAQMQGGEQGPGASTMARAGAQLGNVSPMGGNGSMSDVYSAQTQGGAGGG